MLDVTDLVLGNRAAVAIRVAWNTNTGEVLVVGEAIPLTVLPGNGKAVRVPYQHAAERQLVSRDTGAEGTFRSHSSFGRGLSHCHARNRRSAPGKSRCSGWCYSNLQLLHRCQGHTHAS